MAAFIESTRLSIRNKQAMQSQINRIAKWIIYCFPDISYSSSPYRAEQKLTLIQTKIWSVKHISAIIFKTHTAFPPSLKVLNLNMLYGRKT